MVRLSTLPTLALAAACSLGSAWALNPITIKGTKFFDSVSKNQFFIKGVAYQPRTLSEGFTDPLSNPADCQRDFTLMKDLGLNTIRVYQVDSSLNHDECMKTLEDAGIYLLVDLTTPQYSIVRNNPEYDNDIWNNTQNTIDAFKGYSNTLGFFVGNEVTNDNKTTVASAYVKALLRDAKNYISSTAPRKIPVGYANNDDPDIRLQIQAYFNCGEDEERLDFFGINLYEWCGDQMTYQTSGYAERTKDIASYSIPVFLSEFGCNLVTPRTFPEVKSILGPDMTGNWSGGIVYEWSQEANNYGLVQVQPDNTVTILPDYTNLKNVLAPLHPEGVNMDSYNDNLPESTCPAITAAWEPSENLPPTPSSSACDCMMSSLSCVASDQAVATTENLGTLLNTICGMTSCDDISSNGKTGVYGKYSFCNPSQKLSYMYNTYYKAAATCSFNGMAKLTTATKSSDQGCSSVKNPDTGSSPKTGGLSTGAALKYDGALFSLAVVLAASVLCL
ncbi:Glucanosyltransferase-domain-containing protein [Gamsiella multidivaricata]|uniref:Glucanosyltransferase-domain-containing protein n=1 Tax=Gamsiella multidivaricata TaxID=101098 RepID=UPI0022210014|nr:Glucanosyltransferase-domain-containing protein [Gamsiella multidivaricata]KAI7819851.1 Glucanosyltransferase-domain-containing protein [Gamsiella multidivaricata]